MTLKKRLPELWRSRYLYVYGVLALEFGFSNLEHHLHPKQGFAKRFNHPTTRQLEENATKRKTLIVNLRNELKAIRKRSEGAHEAIAGPSKEWARLEQSRQESEKKHEAALAGLQKRAEAAEKQREIAMEAKAKTGAVMDKMKGELKGLEAQLETSVQEAETARQRLSASENEVASQKAQIETLQTKNHALTAQADERKASLERLETSTKETRAREQEYKTQIETLEKEGLSLKERLEQKSSELAAGLSSFAQAQSWHQERIRKLDDELKAATEAVEVSVFRQSNVELSLSLRKTVISPDFIH